MILYENNFSYYVNSDYHLYPSHRSDPCGTASSQGSFRHDLPASLQQPQGPYPPSHRQYPPYASGSYNAAQYYGANLH